MFRRGSKCVDLTSTQQQRLGTLAVFGFWVWSYSLLQPKVVCCTQFPILPLLLSHIGLWGKTAKLSTSYPWDALAVSGVLSKGWEAASPSQTWKEKNGKKKALKYHKIFTMGVINTVCNVNEQLECSPLVLQLKWRRSWDFPEASPGLYHSTCLPSTEDLQSPYGAGVRGIQSVIVFPLMLFWREENLKIYRFIPIYFSIIYTGWVGFSSARDTQTFLTHCNTFETDYGP